MEAKLIPFSITKSQGADFQIPRAKGAYHSSKSQEPKTHFFISCALYQEAYSFTSSP